MKRIPSLVFVIMIFLDATGFALAQKVNPNKRNKNQGQLLGEEQRIFGLVTIYSAAKQHFAYFEQVPELNWDRAFKEYLPLVQKEQSLLRYYRTLQRFTALLEDGHTNVYLPESLRKQMDNLPIILNYVENQWVITERRPTEEILAQDIPAGTVLLEIDGTETNEYIQDKIFPYIAHGTIQGKRSRVNWADFFPRNAEVRVKLRYPDGDVKTRVIKANRKSVKWNSELHKRYTSPLRLGPDFSTKELDGDVVYVRYRRCTDEVQEKFCKLIQDNKNPAQAMIIDLRGNPGGNTPRQAVQHLISSPISWYLFKTRWSISYIDAQMRSKKDRASKEAVVESKKRLMKLPDGIDVDWFAVTDGETKIFPADKNYKGKLIILIDNETGSAAEDMVVLLHGAGRTTIIGQLSTGSTGEPLMIDLPGGGRVRICTANVKYPDGKEFVGVGIQPDILVNRTIKGIALGKDEIFETAIAYLGNKK
ncbi:MAG: S41 family peptidase [Planctomycetota bacterium]